MENENNRPTIPELQKELLQMHPDGAITQEYGKLEEQLFLSAARGEILTYDEFYDRYDRLNARYKEARKAAGFDEKELDPWFRENTKSSQQDGESLKGYAFRWFSYVNLLEFDGVEFNLPDDDDDD